LLDENEEPVRRAVELAERLAEGKASPSERDAVDADLRRHPIIWAAGGYDLTDAAVPDRTEVAAVEFAALSAEFAFREPAEARQAAQFAAWAEAARTFLATGPAQAAACLVANTVRVRVAGLAPLAASLRRQELHGGERVWVPDEGAEANIYAILAALADALEGQCVLLRELFGPPRSVVADPAWLAWDGGAVRLLVESILCDQAFERMPVLGDALEDAGCTDEAVLGHCRGPDPHTRGCWVIDLVTGRS
jgi:hypothetical protein